jgi:hypothetical protein
MIQGISDDEPDEVELLRRARAARAIEAFATDEATAAPLNLVAFRESCRIASQELEESLAAAGITVDEFMADVMKDI